MDYVTKELTQEEREKYAELFEWIEEDRDSALVASLVLLASQFDNANGYSAFYELIMKMQPPAHVADWIKEIYKADEEGKGIIIEAFRGSTKTTAINIYNAFCLGHRPTNNSLLIQIGDQSATTNTAFIADLIEHHPAWKMVFPHIVPDKERGWGDHGYEIKRSDIDYNEWIDMLSGPEGKKDPHLIGVGYKSGAIIGMHPSNTLTIDDIHDERNTFSVREMSQVISILTGTIFPTMEPGARKIIIGTPWIEGDTLDYCKSTGMFAHIKTPVMRYAAEGEPGAVYFSNEELMDFAGWYVLTWPEKFGKEEIIERRKFSGKKEFARMYLLDLSAADEDGVRFQTYPHERIDTTWIARGGCDYASVMQERKLEQKNRSYFVHLYGFKDPYNRVIIFDGMVEQCTQEHAEINLWKPQTMFLNWDFTMFEADGKGEEAYTTFKRNPGLKIMPFKVDRISKTRRHEILVNPWLENGRVLISDADTPALNRLRLAMRRWPYGNLDVFDAMLALLQAFPECLVGSDYSGSSPGMKKKKKVAENPYKAWCRATHGVRV